MAFESEQIRVVGASHLDMMVSGHITVVPRWLVRRAYNLGEVSDVGQVSDGAGASSSSNRADCLAPTPKH